MGNQIALFQNPDILIQKYLPGLSYSKTMINAQYVNTFMCLKEGEGQIVTKFFPDNHLLLNEPDIMEKMSRIREKFDFRKHPNILVLEFNKIQESGIIMLYAYRQYVYNSLREKILNKIPTLSLIERKWFIFQILCSISQVHNEEMVHGDIKPDNFLVTSYNHVFLTDMVCYKPTYVKGDDLKRYNLYYGELENNQRCYFAPERFKEQYDDSMKNYALLEKSMDIFSAGCVIAEILMDGNPLFDLERLRKYGRGSYDPKPDLEKKIQDPKMVDLIMKMISIEPSKRPSISMCMNSWNEETIPRSYHNVLFQLTSSYVRPQYLFSDMKIALLRKYMPSIWKTCFDSKISTLQIQKKFNEPLERTIFDLIREDNIIDHNRVLIPSNSLFEFIEQDSFSPLKWEINDHDKESASIIIQQIGTFIETCYFPQTKRCALEMLLVIGRESTLEIRLQQILPYVLKIFDEEPRQQSKVIAKAIEVAVMLFENLINCDKMHILSTTDHQVFANYIMPQFTKMLKHHKDDQFIQITYTRYLPMLTKIGRKFTELSVKSRLAQKGGEENQEKKASLRVANIDKEMDTLRKIFIDAIQDTVSSAAKPIRILLYSSFGHLSEFLGSKVTNDFLLSHLIAGANNRDFEINLACLKSIQKIGIKVGKQSIAQFVLIVFITQFLNHSEEIVVLEFIRTLNSLISLRLISKASILDEIDSKSKDGNNHDILNKTIPFLLHPNAQIREATVNFIGILSNENTKIFNRAEVYCIIRPLVKPYLKNQDAVTHFLLTQQSTKDLMKQLREPLSRNTYESMVKTDYKKFEHQLEMKPSDSDKYAIKQLQKTINSTQEKYLRVAQHQPNHRHQPKSNLQTYHEYRVVKAQTLESLGNLVSEDQKQANQMAKQTKTWEKLENRNTDDYNNDGFTPVKRIAEKDVDLQNYGINGMSNAKRVQITEIDHIMQSLSILPDNDNSIFSKMSTKLANQSLAENHFLQIEKLGQNMPQPTQLPQFFHHNSKLAQVQIDPLNQNFKQDLQLGQKRKLIEKFRPEGRLINTLHEHKNPVNCVAVADDQSMFMTASREDGMVLLWSAQDITDVTSHSIQTIQSHNKINDMCMLQGTDYFALAGSNSSVDIYEMGRLSSQASVRAPSASFRSVSNPNYKLPNHSAIVKTLEHKDEGEIINCLNTTLPISYQDLLVYTTQRGSLYMHDLRCKRSVLEQKGAFEQQKGMLTCMTYGQDAYQLLCGTIGGFVMMYDVRYNIVSTVYQHSEKYPINSIACFKPQRNNGSNSIQSPMALVAAGGPVYELSMLNLDTGDIQYQISVNDDSQQRENISAGVTIPSFKRKSLIRDAYNWPEKNENNKSLYNRYLMQTRCLVSSAQLKLTQNLDNEFFKASQDRYRLIKQANESENACRKVIIPRKNTNMVQGTVTADYAITGGNDMKLRYWNLQNLAENSYQINTPNNEECRYIDEMAGGVKYIREQICKEKSFPQLNSSMVNIQAKQGTKTIPNTCIEMKSDSIYYSILQNMIVQKQAGDAQQRSQPSTKNFLQKSSQNEIKSGSASQFQMELGGEKIIVNNFNGLSEWQHFNGLSMNQRNQQDSGMDRYTTQSFAASAQRSSTSSKKDKNLPVTQPYRTSTKEQEDDSSDFLFRESHNVSHSDTILDLAIIEVEQENQPLLITSSRDGTVKIWR